MIRDLLLLKTSRRVCCPQAAKTIKSCSPAACTSENILLRPQVWGPCAKGAQTLRAADCDPLLSEKALPFSTS